MVVAVPVINSCLTDSLKEAISELLSSIAMCQVSIAA